MGQKRLKKTSGKPKGHVINSTNHHVPRGHDFEKRRHQALKAEQNPKSHKIKLLIFCARLGTSPTTTEPGGQLTGLTILYPTDEDNINDESTILDEVVTDEGRRSFNAVNQ